MSDSFVIHIQEFWNHLQQFMEFFIIDQNSLYPEEEESNMDADFLDICSFYKETANFTYDSSCNSTEDFTEDYFENVVYIKSVDESLEKDKNI